MAQRRSLAGSTGRRIHDLRETMASVLYGLPPAACLEAIQALAEELNDVQESMTPALARLARQLTIYSSLDGMEL